MRGPDGFPTHRPHSHCRVWEGSAPPAALTLGAGAGAAAVFPEAVSCLAPGGPRDGWEGSSSHCHHPPLISSVRGEGLGKQ